jgi:gas vesicle protein
MIMRWLMLVVFVGMIVVNDVSCKKESEEAKIKVGEAARDESWTEWAQEKITDTMGFKDAAIDATIDAAKRTKDKATDTASGASKYTSEKTENAKDATKEEAYEVKSTASDVKEAATEKAHETSEEAARGTEENLKWANDKAKEGHAGDRDREEL